MQPLFSGYRLIRSERNAMRLAEAIEGAVAARHPRSKVAMTVQVLVQWRGDPGWRLLRRVGAIRFSLAEIFECQVQLVGSGPGCFYALFALELSEAAFRTKLEMGGKAALAALKARFDVSRMTVRAGSTKASIFK